MESQTWSEMVRQAAREDRRTQTVLAREAGLTQAQISRFLAGKRELLGDALGRLAEVLGLVLVRRL